MALLSRAEYEAELLKLDKREAALNRMLVTCDCGCEQHKHAVKELVDGTEFHRGQCGGCGCPGFSGLIDSFVHETGIQAYEYERRWLKNRLVMGALAIADKKKSHDSGLFAQVIGVKFARDDQDQLILPTRILHVTRRQGPLVRYKSRQFQPTTFEDLRQLQRQGVTLVPFISVKFDKDKDKGWKPVEDETEAPEELVPEDAQWRRVSYEEACRLQGVPGWMVRLGPWDGQNPPTWGEVWEVGV